MKPDFLPTASLEMLRARADLLKQIRSFFDARDFLEVETPILSRDTVVDRYIDPVAVNQAALGLSPNSPQTFDSFWLQTSPEFAMKRILAAGANKIYQIAHAFRAGEAGKRHNPEFSMLEWYRSGDDQDQGIELLGEFACEIFGTSKFHRVEYREIFSRYVGVDGLSEDVEKFQIAATRHDVDASSFGDERDVDAWRNLLLTEVIEPRLGNEVPIIVYDWPASQSALAICRQGTPPVAERFELYFRGTELANGYHELLDADELRRRNSAVNQQRVADGRAALPEHSRLLEAMVAGIQPCSGVAVGIDRLLMILTGKTNISDVMSFTIDNA